MKSFQMKALALAMLGLGGLVMAGSAAAACPTDPAQPNGAWSSKSVASDSVLSIVTPGLNSTSCALSVQVNTGALSNTRAYVTDTSPQDEPHYRARFYIGLSGLSGFSLSNQQVKIFDAFANTSPVNVGTDEVVIRLIGGATPFLRFYVADSAQAANYKIINATLPSSATNSYRVEFDLQQGAPGNFRYWVSDAAASTSDASPTGTYAPNNSGWSGVTQINLGLFNTSPNFRSNNANQAIVLDEFDSRRQTFIGQ